MFSKLSLFGFQALWSPFYFLFLLVIASIYYFVTKRTGNLLEKVTPVQQVHFYGGLFLLYMLKGSPVDLLGHLNFSVHMTQMALVYLVITPILMLGIPSFMYNYVIEHVSQKKIISIFFHPLFGLFFFNCFFSFYHFPVIFDTVKTNFLLHSLFTTILFIGAILLWLPILHTSSNRLGISGIQKVGYIFGAGALLTPACALIIFSGTPLYLTYTDPETWARALQLCVPVESLQHVTLTEPQLFSWFAPLEDQQLGGVLMKVIQEMSYGYMLGLIFFRWMKDEKASDKAEQERVEARSSK